ncbi:hypothetical protein BJV77DRAFT_112336 [Russula vinacea]|nr:hypothetical protein BJV77DRAFT_112336 [Russula vinacea]
MPQLPVSKSSLIFIISLPLSWASCGSQRSAPGHPCLPGQRRPPKRQKASTSAPWAWEARTKTRMRGRVKAKARATTRERDSAPVVAARCACPAVRSARAAEVSSVASSGAGQTMTAQMPRPAV